MCAIAPYARICVQSVVASCQRRIEPDQVEQRPRDDHDAGERREHAVDQRNHHARAGRCARSQRRRPAPFSSAVSTCTPIISPMPKPNSTPIGSHPFST